MATGVSVTESLRLSRFVKARHPEIVVVWGGPHPTFSPEDILQEASVDFIIRGYGSEPFHQLVKRLTGEFDALPLSGIPGLSWRSDVGSVHHNAIAPAFEFIDYRDIPYALIEDMSVYNYIEGKDVIFPVYSVMGCPYRCAFCSSPALYAGFGRKWVPYPVEELVSHIQLLRERYGATLIYFIDDDSFVDLKHVETIMDEIRRRQITIKLAFRGARVNEILGMSDAFLSRLVESGVTALHVGAESGCDRLLALMHKNITAAQTLDANRKLARHPEITVYYNFIVGFPTETPEETKMTRDLMLQLIRDNPQCILLPLNKPRPLPGTELYDLAVRHGYIPPATLKDWGKYELESSDYNPVWMSREHNKIIRMMFLSMYFIDDKIFKLTTGRTMKYRLLKALAWAYRPIAIFRFKYGIYRFLFEDRIYNMVKRFL